MTQAVCEIMWLYQLLMEVDIKTPVPAKLWCDNQVALHIHNKLEYFTDVDWAGSKEEKGSTTGYYVFVRGNLVSWKSKKQSAVSRSNVESEYRAMS